MEGLLRAILEELRQVTTELRSINASLERHNYERPMPVEVVGSVEVRGDVTVHDPR